MHTKQERNILEEIESRALLGKITIDDALLLNDNPSFLLPLADRLRKKAAGESVTYIVNRNINFTNRCIGTCRFCAFKDHNGYILSISEILEKTRSAVESGSTEICIQGGLLPDWDISNYCEILESIKKEYPQLHIHAFSPMEVMHAANNSGLGVRQTISALKEAGLGSMPGTAAEILVDRVREIICPDKLNSAQWLDVVKTAHECGIPTTATIMYGHIETVQERIHHILKIRGLQKVTGGFTEFVPLPFMPDNNRLGTDFKIEASRGIEDLKLHALARVLLYPYFKNIQASWVKLGRKLAQTALVCGANDLGGTLMEEKISKSAGGKSGEYMAPFEFESLIRELHRIPQQRTTLYDHIG